MKHFLVVAKDKVVCENLVRLAMESYLNQRILRSVSAPNKACSRLVGFVPTYKHFSGFGLFSALEANLVPPTSG